MGRIVIIERQRVICCDVNRNNRVTGWLTPILHRSFRVAILRFVFSDEVNPLWAVIPFLSLIIAHMMVRFKSGKFGLKNVDYIMTDA